jgi:hypothetical protein
MRCRCLAFTRNDLKRANRESLRQKRERVEVSRESNLNIFPLKFFSLLVNSSAFQFSTFSREKEEKQTKRKPRSAIFMVPKGKSLESREREKAWALIFSMLRLSGPSPNSTSAYRVSRQPTNERRRREEREAKKTCFDKQHDCD